MIFGMYVKSKTLVLHCFFFIGFVQFVFLSQVGPRDQTSEGFGAQHGPESDLWSDISDPKIDNNSGSKKQRVQCREK